MWLLLQNYFLATVEEKSKYDYFFSSKIFGYLSGSFKKDHIADLDYRTIYGSGLGYQWIDEEDLGFSTWDGISTSSSSKKR